MASKKVYFGRFISTPTPTELLIQSGAVLVVGGDGAGVIEEVDWEVKTEDEARERFGGGKDGEVDVVKAVEDGFFFPGFIGL